MLKAPHRAERGILRVTAEGSALLLKSEYGLLRLMEMESGALRVSFVRGEDFPGDENRFVNQSAPRQAAVTREDDKSVTLEGERLSARVSKDDGTLCICDAKSGKLLFREGGLRTLEAFEAKRISRNAKAVTEQIETADGVKTAVREAPLESYKRLYRARLPLCFDGDEALYGLGQPESGPANLRGRKMYLCQMNRQIALPFFASTAGYGLLIDCGCPFVFCDNDEGSYLYLTAVEQLDYYVIPGGGEEAVKGYHRLTGLPSAMPAWVFGYWQSQERYETQQEILALAQSYKDAGIGLDCAVLDWCSWPDGQWGQKSFDPERFPDPDAMTQKLHDMDVHFMISIWPNMNPRTSNNAEFKSQGLLLPGGEIYDALNPAARRLYWQQARRGLYCHGVDAWWCDSSEPWTSEWSRREEPLDADVFFETTKTAAEAIGADKGNAFALYHARTLAEGQREESPDRRVVNLTRSAWTGQQRYGAVLWSGDVTAKWETLKKQIAIGLDMAASGMPYWTLDIGGFFVKRGESWYWDGDYEQGWDDPGFRELFLRWYQYAAFLPVFRGHGTDVRRELFNLKGEEFDIALKYNKARYQLLPYLYSLSCQVARDGGSMIKPLGFGYPDDARAKNVDDAFLLGDNLLVCPVTQPGARERAVYLPEGLWYELASGKALWGGREYTAYSPLDTIPVFVKAGAVLPVVKPCLSAGKALEQTPEFWIFPGADGKLSFYTDSGDGALDGKTRICFWNDDAGRLMNEGGADIRFKLFGGK